MKLAILRVHPNLFGQAARQAHRLRKSPHRLFSIHNLTAIRALALAFDKQHRTLLNQENWDAPIQTSKRGSRPNDCFEAAFDVDRSVSTRLRPAAPRPRQSKENGMHPSIIRESEAGDAWSGRDREDTAGPLPGGSLDQGGQPEFVGVQTARKDVRLRKAEQFCPRRSPEARSEAPRCRPATSRSA